LLREVGPAHECPRLLGHIDPVPASHWKHIAHASTLCNDTILILASKVKGMAATETYVREHTKGPYISCKTMVMNLQTVKTKAKSIKQKINVLKESHPSGFSVKHLWSAVAQCA
jgi:hypothetical protein